MDELQGTKDGYLQKLKVAYPQKFTSLHMAFAHIHAGDRIFIGTGCGEPQYLVGSLVKYVQSNPKAFFDAELLQVWTLGLAPYMDVKFQKNFRHNSFFIGRNAREAVNRGLADYTPVFLSEVPQLFRRKQVPVDVALIQVSLPDAHGYLSLGISVDIVKAAVESASTVIAQVNPRMPRVHGDTFLHVEEMDYLIPYDEELLEYENYVPGNIARRIGCYVARIIQDGDTIQVGYGSMANAIVSCLEDKRHLGIHTELLSDGLIELMKKGVVDNTRKTIDRCKTVASFCMGTIASYTFLHDNPAVEFRTIDYTNNPLVIAQINNMTAINATLEIDLTGQSTAESLGKLFYSGIGGQANFMRGTVLAPGGKTILILQSTTENEERSRIVPYLREGAGVTLTRGDLHYVVTEHGIAYLHGKNIRERAMSLIAIAHPLFRSWLIEEAKKLNLIYKDQVFVTGEGGQYREELETYRTTKTGLRLLLRPVKISDEPLLKDFFYALSDQSIHKRFISIRRDMPHEMLQEQYLKIDYSSEMVILAVIEQEESELVAGIGQYAIDDKGLTAEVALVVRDSHQNKGIGVELLTYLSFLAKKQGLLGFTGEALGSNLVVLHLFDKLGFDVRKHREAGVFLLDLAFKDI